MTRCSSYLLPFVQPTLSQKQTGRRNKWLFGNHLLPLFSNHPIQKSRLAAERQSAAPAGLPSRVQPAHGGNRRRRLEEENATGGIPGSMGENKENTRAAKSARTLFLKGRPGLVGFALTLGDLLFLLILKEAFPQKGKRCHWGTELVQGASERNEEDCAYAKMLPTNGLLVLDCWIAGFQTNTLPLNSMKPTGRS